MVDSNYKQLVEKVLNEGYLYDDPNREGVQRLEIPSYEFRHDFNDGFPAITLKKLAFKSVVTELIWFLKGDTNIKHLVDNGCNIWNKDAYNYYIKQFNNEDRGTVPMSIERFIELIKDDRVYEKSRVESNNYKLGDLGKVYGHYWRNFNGIDQIAELIHNMINKPMSSELLVVARDPSHKDEQALPCCHYGFQIIMRPLTTTEMWNEVIQEGVPYGMSEEEAYKIALDNGSPQYGFELHWKQRSCDLFLGIPFNIASYALLALILEKITGHKALGIQGDLKNVHLYDNSIEEAKELIKREPSNERVLLQGYPITELMDEFDDKPFNLNEFIERLDEVKSYIKLIGYNPQPPMRVEMLSRS